MFFKYKMEDSPENFINVFSAAIVNKKQPTVSEQTHINNLINSLPDDFTEETKQEFICAIQYIWSAYYDGDWRTHVRAIIGKWYYTHSNRYYQDSPVEQNDRHWMQTALDAASWNDALAAIPVEVLTCWGI